MAAAAGAIVSAAAAAAARRRREEQSAAIAKSFEVWLAFGEARALFSCGDATRPALTGDPQGIPCWMGVELDASGWAYTRASAAPPNRVPCRVGVYPSPGGILGYFRSLLGQDVEIGDAPFDRSFLIHSEPALAARSLLGPTIRDILTVLAGRSFSGFTYEPGRVLVQWPGVELDPEILGGALDLVIEAARWTLGGPYR